jgi:hypothetical protein
MTSSLSCPGMAHPHFPPLPPLQALPAANLPAAGAPYEQRASTSSSLVARRPRRIHHRTALDVRRCFSRARSPAHAPWQKPYASSERSVLSLQSAVNQGDALRVRELLEMGADACCSDDLGRYPVHFAATKGDCDMLDLLAEYGASVNVRDFHQNTPLHLAACTHHVQAIAKLLELGEPLFASSPCTQFSLRRQEPIRASWTVAVIQPSTMHAVGSIYFGA